MTRKYQGVRNILRNQVRIPEDVPPSSPELVVRVVEEDFPALRPGRRQEQKPNPIKVKGKLMNRPNIETSNAFKVLALEETSAPDTEKDIEMETNQEWTQTRGTKEGGNKAPNLTLNIVEATGGSSSQKRMVKSPAEATNKETDGRKLKKRKKLKRSP
ncbi:hypothetical protein JTB14_003219 [Gonioctena quinquepunctata]|nr:hypothetical protein JTB14_003219 [Gonioctena quinquepunctata]